MSQVYIEYRFKVEPEVPGREILVAELAQLGFESFTEEEDVLLAYIQKHEWEETRLREVNILTNPNFRISYQSKQIEQVNWNAEWEKHFDPIVVSDICAVRAPFHKEFGVAYEIVIEPKMSFGTGHHETTFMMLEHLLDLDLHRKHVLDMGCGTAVLAILAEMRGAVHIDAVDIDSWCVENSEENAQRNNCEHINVWQGDIDSVTKESGYDIIIANINRNILLRHIPHYRCLLKEDGILLLSGFYHEDLQIIKECCADCGMKYDQHLIKNNWVAAKFVN